ncbi:hypothetical protein BC826DRAFT_973468 [Russula brevipes]|nr:hypothetical protein BC826DRAFT_973468 [Russula brevipes]
MAPALSEVAEQAISNAPNAPSSNAPLPKKQRNAGRPMQLALASEDRIVDLQDQLWGREAVAKGKGIIDKDKKGQQIEPNGNKQLLNVLDASDSCDSEAHGGDTDVETEADWIDEPHLTELAQKQPSKFEEAMKLERASWTDLTPTPDCSSVQMQTGTQGLPVNVDTLQEHKADTSLMEEASEPQWPEITNLHTVLGSNRVTLSVQVLLMWLVIQDAFEHVCASLLFNHAYLEPIAVIGVVKEALLAAAGSHKPAASSIHNRLVHDDPYVFKMSRLPHAWIPLFRSEVKEHCGAVVVLHFAAVNSVPEITQMVERQLKMYNYTFPGTPGRPGLVMCSHPYCNDRIIKYSDTEWKHEVLIPMVALIATGLFAMLYEWRTGKQKAAEFSTTSYLDVYDGHVNTLVYIRDNRNVAFHTMMADIYAQAIDHPNMEATPGAAMVAPLNLTDLNA